jgi:hypothetical protein
MKTPRPRLAAQHGASPALEDPHHSPPAALSYAELSDHILHFAAGLCRLGLTEKGARVCLFSENSHRWLIADQAVQTCGAATCLRGGTSGSREELVSDVHTRILLHMLFGSPAQTYIPVFFFSFHPSVGIHNLTWSFSCPLSSPGLHPGLRLGRHRPDRAGPAHAAQAAAGARAGRRQRAPKD